MKAPDLPISPFHYCDFNYRILLDQVSDQRFIGIGEATHGTQEFYHLRAEVTKRLILEAGFNAVVIEGDWPDAYQINHYIKNGQPIPSMQTLEVFKKRFPEWMWANKEVLNFIEWLKEYNHGYSDPQQKIGFYGLDMYSLYTSVDQVIQGLEKLDPEAAYQARKRYACLEIFRPDPQVYGYASTHHGNKDCEQAVLAELQALQAYMQKSMVENSSEEKEKLFYILQNARLVKSAESYYKAMYLDNVLSWNLRDQHMMETVVALEEYLRTCLNKPPKIIVWAHNSHLGDARATEHARLGEWNLGQLLREEYPQECLLIGFSTYQGYVMAASNWGDPGKIQKLNPAIRSSYEDFFHQVGHENFLLDLTEDISDLLKEPNFLRAVGVIYKPETEFQSHYLQTYLSKQFDLLFHMDTTHAVQPL